MPRKPREHGWRNSDGITHYINTRRPNAYHSYMRTGTCGVDLRQAKRVRFDSVDCITCIVHAARQPRWPPRPQPKDGTPSWWMVGGTRHEKSAHNPWRAVCGASLRPASASGNPPNCQACGASPKEVARTRSRRTSDGVRHAIRFDNPKPAPCGADLTEAKIVRKPPNCGECRAAIRRQRAKRR